MPLLDGIKMTNLGPKVEIGKVFGGEVSYSALAAAFHVNAHDILIAVQRAKGTNEQALRDLYKAHFGHFNIHRFETDLASQAHQYWFYAHGGVDGIPEYRLPFLRWKIPAHVTIRLPHSITLPHLLRGDERSQSRIIRFGVEHPDFSRLDLLSDRLFDLATKIEEPVEELQKKVLPAARKSLSYLLSAERVLSLINGAIPDTMTAWVAHHGEDHADLHDSLGKVIDRCTELLVDEPTFIDRGTHREVKKLVAEVLSEMAEPSNVAMLEKLSPFYDVVEERDVWERFEGALLLSARAVMRSGQSKRFLEDHFLPFLGALAEAAEVQKLVDNVSDAAIRSAILDDWRQIVPSKPKTLLSTFGSIGSVGAGAVGNSRGPSSLAVSLVSVAGPASCNLLARRSLALTRSGTLAAGLSLRLVMRLARLSSAHDLESLWSAIDKQDLEGLRKIDWSAKVMSGNVWAGVYGIANAAVFYVVLTSDAELTLRRFTQILQSGTQLAVPVAELAAVFAGGTKAGRALAPKLLKTASGLAWVATVLGVGLAIWVAAESVLKIVGDEGRAEFEDALNIAGSVGAALAAGGWMYIEAVGHCAGAAATMAIGSILSFTVLVVAIAYQAATAVSGAGTYVRVCVDTFLESAEGKELLQDGELRRAVRAFEGVWERVDSNIVSLSSQKEHLGDLARYFSPDGCAMILEMNPALVRAILGVD